MWRRRFAGLAGWLASALLVGAGDAEQTLVLANRNLPASVELARYYLAQRGVPEDHLVLLDLPDETVLSRTDYERKLRDPLLAYLRRAGLVEQEARAPEAVGPHETAWTTTRTSLRYLVSMYGVPLRIQDSKSGLGAKVIDRFRAPEYKNTAAVDSELALLLHPGYPINGFVANPLYGLVAPRQLAELPFPLLMATRLDAPTPERVRAMIDETLQAERHGLQGRCYFDSRSLQDEYFIGDYWIREAYERFLREGYECVLDVNDTMWSEAYPMQDAAVYIGWYAESVTGPFTREDFTFRPGAVAYHLHSGSAVSLRSATEYWAGPLLHRGAAVTMGAVHEPYLAFTPVMSIFSDRLCRGHTFAESAYMSLTHLSWQITMVGDPLYRPFRYPLEEQMRHLEDDGEMEGLAWAIVRRVNLLLRDGRFHTALRACLEGTQRLESLVVAEKLADLYGINEDFQKAGAFYASIIEQTDEAATALRVGSRWLLILRLTGHEEEADALEARLRERWAGSPMLGWLVKSKP